MAYKEPIKLRQNEIQTRYLHRHFIIEPRSSVCVNLNTDKVKSFKGQLKPSSICRGKKQLYMERTSAEKTNSLS